MKVNNQKGAAVVEFALVLPLLLLLLFGIIEFSILLYDKALLTNASREGARVGIVHVPDRVASLNILETNINDTVTNYCGTNLISFGNDTLPPPTKNWSGYASGDTLTVTVNYNFRFLIFSNLISLFGGNFNNGIPLRAVTAMRLE